MRNTDVRRCSNKLGSVVCPFGGWVGGGGVGYISWLGAMDMKPARWVHYGSQDEPRPLQASVKEM